MSMESWIDLIPGLLLVAVAVIALKPNRDIARANREISEANTEHVRLQQDLMKAQVQPYVWAGIEGDMKQGGAINLKVRNEGPTVAKNIRVTIDPLIVNEEWDPGRVASIQRQLSSGIKSLAPRQELKWYIGQGGELLNNASPEEIRKVTVSADGPYGPTDQLEFEIHPHDWALATDDPDGSLHLIRKELKNVTKGLSTISSELKKTGSK